MPSIRIGARCLVGEKYGEIFDIAGKDFQQRWFVVKYDDGTKEQVEEGRIHMLPKGFKENANDRGWTELKFKNKDGEIVYLWNEYASNRSGDNLSRVWWCLGDSPMNTNERYASKKDALDWLQRNGYTLENDMENQNSLCFCPHCGEDLREPLIADTAPVEEAVPTRRQVIKREVTTREIEALWGLTPLPTGMRPFGVITDGVSDVPQALACESNAYKDDKIWELRVGESKLFDPEIPTKPSVTAPGHVCNGLTTIEEREQLGNSKYGSKK